MSPFFGHSENDAQKTARQKHDQDLKDRQEAQQKAEAARDPYRTAVSWNVNRR